jgi:hypothetical protein
MSRLMKTLARQGSRYQAKETYRHHESGMPWDGAAEKAAEDTLLWAARKLRRKHLLKTRRRAYRAALRFTGWKPKTYCMYWVEKQ